MIASLVQHRILVRPVSPQGRLARGGYMDLSWSPECPGMVWLTETEPDADGQAVFPRDLLIRALDGEPSAEGQVCARLRHLRGATHALLSLTVPGVDGLTELGICDTAIASFVRETTDLVPPGEEWRLVVDTVADLLSEAA